MSVPVHFPGSGTIRFLVTIAMEFPAEPRRPRAEILRELADRLTRPVEAFEIVAITLSPEPIARSEA